MRRNAFLRVMGSLLALLILICPKGYAAIDTERGGSIRIVIETTKDRPVWGAKLELYRVGSIHTDGGLWFTLSGNFKDSGVTLTDTFDRETAEAFDEYIRTAQKKPPTQRNGYTDEEGQIEFRKLKTGLYLVRQNGFVGTPRAAEIDPFLVSVPTSVNGKWDYSITAKPKVEPIPGKEPENPKPTKKPPEIPEDEKLPQTGMLLWPVPVLACGGLVLFAAGWALCFMVKKDDNA